jgi:acyl-CoA thioester hydrolase
MLKDGKSHLPYTVPYADTDQMGVVYYANFLVYFERARSQLLRDIGFPYKEMERRGFALPVVEAHVDYKAPAGFEDELVISAWVGWVKGVRLQVCCAVHRGDQLLATGHTVHACIDIKTRKPVRVIPEIADVCGLASGGTAPAAAAG